MHPVQIYSSILGGMLALLFLYQISSRILSWAQRRTIFYIFKYLVYPLFLKRRLLFGTHDPLGDHARPAVLDWYSRMQCHRGRIPARSWASSRFNICLSFNPVNVVRPTMLRRRPFRTVSAIVPEMSHILGAHSYGTRRNTCCNIPQ